MGPKAQGLGLSACQTRLLASQLVACWKSPYLSFSPDGCKEDGSGSQDLTAKSQGRSQAGWSSAGAGGGIPPVPTSRFAAGALGLCESQESTV